MGLKSMVVKTGATFGAMVGGTDLTFQDDGVSVQNGVHLIVPATADYRVRQSITAKYKPPGVTAGGVYGRDSKSLSYTVPFVLASGLVVFNVVRLERQVHPEFTAAAALDLLTVIGQTCFDTDTTNFWAAGSLS